MYRDCLGSKTPTHWFPSNIDKFLWESWTSWDIILSTGCQNAPPQKSIGTGRLTNMWDAAAITFYLRCNLEYCLWRMPGMPRYTLSILKLVGSSGTRGFWDVPHDLTNDCCTNFELLSGLSTKMATCFEAGNWLIPLCTLHNCMSPCRVFGIFQTWCLASAFTVWSQVIASQAFGGWFRCSGCSKICLSTSKLFTHKSSVTSHLKAWPIGILILVWFIDHNPGPV